MKTAKKIIPRTKFGGNYLRLRAAMTGPKAKDAEQEFSWLLKRAETKALEEAARVFAEQDMTGGGYDAQYSATLKLLTDQRAKLKGPVVRREKKIDFRGKPMNNTITPDKITLEGIRFTEAIMGTAQGNKELRAHTSEYNVGMGISIHFFRPFFDNSNTGVLVIEFPTFKMSEIPAVIVNPATVNLDKGTGLADVVVAQCCTVSVTRKGKKVEFAIHFNDKVYRQTLTHDCMVNAQKPLSHFIEFTE